MRLYERVAKGGWDFGALAEQHGDADRLRELRDVIDQRLRQAIRIDVQNVHDYYHSDASKPEYDWKEDYPNLAPPFQTFWMEYRHQYSDRDRAESEAYGLDPETRTNKVGVLAFGHRYDHGFGLEMIEFVGKANGGITGAFKTVMLSLDEHGAPNDYPKVLLPYTMSPAWQRAYGEIFSDLSECGPFGLAISLMHCKNVVIDDAPDDRSKKQRKKDERLGREPVQFKTLMIEPMKRVLRTEGHSDTNGIKKAMHICRGHFKTYTEDKPRFGRDGDYGQFWIEAHVRGSADVGMVGKDYAVKAPRE